MFNVPVVYAACSCTSWPSLHSSASSFVLLLFIVQTMRGLRAHQVVRGALLAVLLCVGFMYWCLRSLSAHLEGALHHFAAERPCCSRRLGFTHKTLLKLRSGSPLAGARYVRPAAGARYVRPAAKSAEVGIAHCWPSVAHKPRSPCRCPLRPHGRLVISARLWNRSYEPGARYVRPGTTQSAEGGIAHCWLSVAHLA